jgi:hypothetical protein
MEVVKKRKGAVMMTRMHKIKHFIRNQPKEVQDAYIISCHKRCRIDNLEYLEWKLEEKEKENQICPSNKIS